jgi:uncharacterized cupin superfamily protein
MQDIIIEHHVPPAKLDVLFVDDWPVWTREISEFDWEYARSETCYIVEGEAIVTPEGGEAVKITRGDLVTFPAGMRCRWRITSDIEKHYRLT